MKTLYILRAVPGAGKSTVADHIALLTRSNEDLGCVICCADDYFTDADGNYNWDPEKIGNAHGWCKGKFKRAIEEQVSVVIVSNTNVTNSDVNWYRNRAIEAGYTVFVLVVENRHDGVDVHNVPEEIKEKMRESLKNSIKL